MIISSFDNQKVKYIAALSEKKHRLMCGEYVAEGTRWVFDALKHFDNADKEQVVLIAVSESQAQNYAETLKPYEDKVIVCSDRVFEKLSDEKNSQGILAVFKMRQKQSVNGNFCLFLDRVRDPGNLGTILRTAAAAGFSSVLCRDCVDVYNSKVIRSSMTAILKLNIMDVDFDVVTTLKNDGFKLVCADIAGENVFLNIERFEKICLVIGNEANGIDEDISKLADLKLCIPMEGIESLNASVSAGILMYMLKYKI